MKFPKTLRSQLSVWYFGSIAITLGLLVFLIAVLLQRTLKNQIDHHIHLVVTEAQRIVELNDGAEERNRLENLVAGQGMTVVLLSPDGSPLLQTNSPDVAAMSEHQMQQLLLQQPTTSGQPLHFTVNNMRFATALVPTVSGNNILAVGYSTQVIEDTVRNIVSIVGLLVAVTVLPLGLVGYYLLIRAIHPLERMARTAKTISHSQDLSIRISREQKTQELKSLADSFNDMLSRLERVFKTEHQFFSDAAHTIKTPLAILRLQAERLPASTQEVKSRLLKQIDQLSVITQDLLFISRLETHAVTPQTRVCFSVLVAEVLEVLEVLAHEKNITITSSITKNLWVIGDKSLLNRAFANVLQNAISYTPKQGIISVTLHQKKQQVICKVTDTGIGIPKAEQKHIFERFYRGKNTQTTAGSGLGLAMTRVIMEQHQGSIQLTSKQKSGATVILRLPASSN